MTRGNQRELARQKNIKKQQEIKKNACAEKKTGNKGLSLEERRHSISDGKVVIDETGSLNSCLPMYISSWRDAEQMRLKQKVAASKNEPKKM